MPYSAGGEIITLSITIWHDGENVFSGNIGVDNFTVNTMDQVKEKISKALDEYAKTE